MNAIRVRTHLDSETLHLPQLRPLVGKDVEIVVVEDEAHGASSAPPSAAIRPARSIEQLAAAQGVEPIRDYRDLLGGWPLDELNNGFEEDLDRRRKIEIVGNMEL